MYTCCFLGLCNFLFLLSNFISFGNLRIVFSSAHTRTKLFLNSMGKREGNHQGCRQKFVGLFSFCQIYHKNFRVKIPKILVDAGGGGRGGEFSETLHIVLLFSVYFSHLLTNFNTFIICLNSILLSPPPLSRTLMLNSDGPSWELVKIP